MLHLLIFVLSLTYSSLAAEARPLEVTKVQYIFPENIPSCTLLRHRENERNKVLRELTDLRDEDLLLTNSLMINKFFLDEEVWQDETVLVSFEIPLSHKHKKYIEARGFNQVFLKIRGPGIVWQSYIYQVPEDVVVELKSDPLTIMVSYPTYLGQFCDKNLGNLTVDWVEREPDLSTNSRLQIENLLERSNPKAQPVE